TRLRHRLPGDGQGLAHPARHGPGDEQHVGVPRGGDDPEPAALQVVVGAGHEGELVLAAVAGAGVDVADGQAAAAARLREVEVPAEYDGSMCRNIHTLFNFEPPATDDEVRAAALQYVRKISGFTNPSQANEEAFARAVEGVAEASRR